MPIDRAATLRNAEKLLRQGKLELAIAEYVRVVKEHPRDWNTANVLGDLYVRANQVDRAVEQFTRIADHLNEEGFFSKAAALYKKILKLKPEDERSLLQSGEIAATQGLLADARSYFNTVADRRRSRGDERGAAEIRIRVGTLDPADYEARANAARARAALGEADAAVGDLKGMAAELVEKGREADAIEVLREAALIRPDDEQLREQLLQVYLAAGDFVRARQCAATIDQIRRVAEALDAAGQHGDALEVLRDAARLDPSDAALRADLAQAFVARGDLDAAAEFLTLDAGGNDPRLLQAMAEIQIRAGRLDEGLAALQQLMNDDPKCRDQIAFLGWTIAERDAEAGFRVVDLVADAAVAHGDWASAAAALQEFVTRVPGHIPALMRLVGICVDGGLEATMYSAQAQLADAYIAAGSAMEARVIAEDLVAREPWERANIERFRRTLVLLGEPDPDALIAERLSGQTPFTTTDLLAEPELPTDPETERPRPTARQAERPPPPPAPVTAAVPDPAPAPVKKSGKPKPAKNQFALGPNAIDLSSILGDLDAAPLPPSNDEPPAAAPRRASESVEVDLSVVLDDIRGAQPATPSPPDASGEAAGQPPAPSAMIEADDLEGVFEQLRAEASRQSPAEAAEDQYRRALALLEAGLFEESVEALRAASRAPALRFRAGSRLARLYREAKDIPQAIDWFERAAEAPAPNADEYHVLLYELAELLEATGEVARALAICLELQADAGDYKDVATRVDRLSRVQTRG